MLAMATPPDLNTQVGVPMVSEGVIVKVIESPLLPLPVPPTARTAADAVGCVLSIVTAPEEGVVTATPAFPAVSSKAIENVTAPLVSPSATTIEHVLTLPAPVP